MKIIEYEEKVQKMEAQLKKGNTVTNFLEVARGEVAVENEVLREAQQKFFTKINEIQDYLEDIMILFD